MLLRVSGGGEGFHGIAVSAPGDRARGAGTKESSDGRETSEATLKLRLA